MTKRTPSGRTLGLVVLLAMLIIATASPPVTAQTVTEPAFVVEVHPDGSATVIVRSTFDLTTDAEREAFESLVDDEEAQQNARNRFLDRMGAVASDAENATGREMSVTGPAIDLRRTDDEGTGIVTISVTWEGLAAVDGEVLRVNEPFASGFSSDRPTIVRAPDGYTVASVTPEPDEWGEASATWKAGTDLTGLSVELMPEETPTSTDPAADDEVTETDGQPGFGMLAALVAVIAATAIATVRRTVR